MTFTRRVLDAFRRLPSGDESGFSLVEFVISSVVLLIMCAGIFSILAETQRSASYQGEVQTVLENTRIAMEMIERQIRQAGNDPNNISLVGVTITSSYEVRLRSDITGSAGGDKGDPDGDTEDSGEDVIFRCNAEAQTIEMVPAGGAAQSIANYISAFSMQYYDAAGATTTIGADVRRIRVNVTGATTLQNPQTGQVFSVQLGSDVQLATRQ